MIQRIVEQKSTPKRILIIDDEELLSWCIAFQLRSDGYDVLWASDMTSGIAHLVAFAPQLVICDQTFPDGKGFLLLNEAKKSGNVFGSILITAYTPPSQTQLREINAYSCLSKPFTIQTLINLVDSFFQNLDD